jgi:hypothetical protein
VYFMMDEGVFGTCHEAELVFAGVGLVGEVAA